MPSVLLRNRDGKSFVDVTASSGTGELHKGHGVAFADLDNDGDEEIVFEVGGVTPGDAHAFRLFKNPGHGNDWITLKLVGVKTNRAAIGARIKVTVKRRLTARARSTALSAAADHSARRPCSSTSVSARLRSIVDLEIWWPTSNTRQHFADVALNRTLEIKEFAKSPTYLERRPLPLSRNRE